MTSDAFFAHASLADAERAADAAGRWLFVHFVAADSPQSRRMEATWADARLKAEVDAFAESARVDVDERPDCIPRFEVRVVPNVTCRTPDGTLVRQVTCRTADQLLTWLTFQRRYQQMAMRIRAGCADDALDELKFHWVSCAEEVRWLDFVPLLARAARDSTRVRRHFEGVRDAIPTALFGEPRSRMPDWLLLNEALDDVARSLAWFDARAEGVLPMPSFARLRNAVLRRGRAADLLLFAGDRACPRPTPTAAVTRALDQLGALQTKPAHDLELRRSSLTTMRRRIALLLCGSEDATAIALHRLVRESDGSEEMAVLLAQPFDELRDADLAFVDRRGPPTSVERL